MSDRITGDDRTHESMLRGDKARQLAIGSGGAKWPRILGHSVITVRKVGRDDAILFAGS